MVFFSLQFSVSTINSTLGQDILDLKYDGMLNGQWITTAQKRAYAILTICLPWLLERKYTFMRSTESIPYNEKVLVEYIFEIILRSINLLCSRQYQYLTLVLWTLT